MKNSFMVTLEIENITEEELQEHIVKLLNDYTQKNKGLYIKAHILSEIGKEQVKQIINGGF